jgi:hypothetical protein
MIAPGWLIRLLAFKPFKGRTGPEDDLAIQVGSALRVWTLEGRLNVTFTHVPHEVGGAGGAAKTRMALAKAMGLIAGSGDYVFIGSRTSGWIELKSATGSLSPIQRDFRDWCTRCGVEYAVCRTVDNVEATLKQWDMLS